MKLEHVGTLTFGPSDRQKTAASSFSVRAVGGNPLAGPQAERYPGAPIVAQVAGTTAVIEQVFGDGDASGAIVGRLAYAQRTARRSEGSAEVAFTGLITLGVGGHMTVRGQGHEDAGGWLVLLLEFEGSGAADPLTSGACLAEGRFDAASATWSLAVSRLSPGAT